MSNTCQICQIRVKFCLRFFGPSVKLDPRRQSVKTDPDAIPSVKPSKPIRARSPLSNRRACCQTARDSDQKFHGPTHSCIDLDRAGLSKTVKVAGAPSPPVKTRQSRGRAEALCQPLSNPEDVPGPSSKPVNTVKTQTPLGPLLPPPGPART